ncbi:MAG: glycosyltransferase [Planctomycetes bacterium]|nr:glycosyltransferase [Planctomycetota bacterium]
MRLLVLTPFLPRDAAEHGGGAYLGALLGALAARATVDLVSFVTPAELAARHRPDPGLRQVDLVARAERCDRAGLAAIGHRARMLRSFALAGLPVVAAKFASPTLRAVLATRLATERYDAVLCEMNLMAQYLPATRGPDGPLRVLTDHEGGDPVVAAIGPLGLGRRRDARLWRRYVERFYPRADLLQALNEVDAQRLTERLGRSVAVRPASVTTPVAVTDLAAAEPVALFFGDFRHGPNPEAARFLAERVAPLLRPGTAAMWIAGRDSQRALPAATAAVSVLGFVDDLSALLGRVRAVVAPVFSGSGTRIKILTALAHGVPVITNALGARGLGTQPAGVVLAETPDAIAAAIMDLTTRPATDLGAAARAAHLREHVPAAAAARQLALLEGALRGPPRAVGAHP